MSLFLLAAALAQPLRGEAVSFGHSEVRTQVEAVPAGLLVQVYWPAFDRHTLEAVIAFATSCAGEDLVGGRARVSVPVRCVDAWVDEPHPVYDYTERTHVRCVLGEGQAACKLGYTPWFSLAPGR